MACKAVKKRPHGALVGLGAAGLALGLLAVLQLTGFHAFSFNSQSGAPSQSANQPVMTMPDGSTEKFTYLAAQHSNSCGLTAQTVNSYPDSTRLQGSCCSAMDMSVYQAQIQGLKAYRDIPGVPSDPHDVPISDAKKWLAYDSPISLTGEQQAVYDKAISMTKDKAPCCCKCWRWYMNRGLAKYLIANLNWSADRMAPLITLLDGCGGK